MGGGLAYMNDAGLEINSEFDISDGKITLSPSFDYYFPGDNVTSFALNFDGHYNLGDMEGVNYYPIAGLNYYYWSVDLSDYGVGTASDGAVGLNLGFGASMPLNESIRLYGEGRIVMNDYTDDFGLAIGVLFSLGK